MNATKTPGLAGKPQFMSSSVVENVEQDMDRPQMRETPEQSLRRSDERMAMLQRAFGDNIVPEGSDEYFIPKDKIPPGWSWEWKVFTVMGAEDPGRRLAYARTGWEAVKTWQFPERMPEGTDPQAPILHKGMMLMERPEQITEQVRRNDERRARDQVRVKEDQLNSSPHGQFERDNKGQPMGSVRKNVERMPVPE